MMASRSWCIVMVVLACFQCRVAADCKVAGPEGESCHQCYQTLESYLLNTSDNKYQLRRVFYPLEVAAPVIVAVTYRYIGTNTTNLWFWSMGIFYFLQPIEVFQFTSLFFGNPSWRNSKLNITLPSECVNASNEFMTELTQMLKLYATKLKPNPEIHSTYQADAFNMDTLDHLYTDTTFFNTRHPDLLYCFQMLFPPFTIVLLVVYGCASYYSTKRYVKKHIKYSTSWAAVTTHAIISLGFTLFVVILDVVALAFRKAAPDYYTESFHAPLFHYPGLTLFWDGIALTTIMTVMIMVMIMVCCVPKLTQCKQQEFVFQLLTLAGVVPLLCFASHAQYLFIAAITDTFYATGIGIYYGIFYYVHISLLKKTYEGLDQHTPVYRDDQTAKIDQPVTVQLDDQHTPTDIEEVALFNYKAMMVVFVVFFVTVCYQTLITAFYVFLPINQSVESLPSHLFRILQVASSLLVSLLAYKIIFGIQATPSLSAISSAIRNFLLKKKDENSNLRNKRNWDTLDQDKKLTHLLHELYDSMIIRVTPVNQQQQSQEQPPKEQPPKEQPPKEQPPKEPPKEQSPKEQPPKEQSPKEQPPKEQPPMEQSPMEQPPKEQPPMEQSPKEQSPKEQPPMEQPPMEQPPKEQPPMEQPPKEQSIQQLPPHAQQMIELQQLEQQQTSNQQDQRET